MKTIILMSIFRQIPSTTRTRLFVLLHGLASLNCRGQEQHTPQTHRLSFVRIWDVILSDENFLRHAKLKGTVMRSKVETHHWFLSRWGHWNAFGISVCREVRRCCSRRWEQRRESIGCLKPHEITPRGVPARAKGTGIGCFTREPSPRSGGIQDIEWLSN